jgi:predicted phosphodiesterase
MIIGVLSDTHKDAKNALPHIVAEFKKRGVQLIIHCGDIIPKHLDAELFGGLPVVCALIEEQVGKEEFKNPPVNWTFTRPGDRIYRLNGDESMYVGHKLSFEFLTGSEEKLIQKLNEIRRDHDGVRWLFSGHTHHQIFNQSRLINFVNPGAIEDSFDGYEFAVINTENEEIVFGRIPKTIPTRETFSVGVISDSLNISEMDPDFWKLLVEEFKKRGVRNIIHCGNIALCDIGRPEFADFQVFYNLRPDQRSEKFYSNWQQITVENPVVEINGYKFYVQLDLGAALLEKSEVDMHMLCLGLRRKYPEISFVLCGFTNNASLEEGEQVRIINPGDISRDRNFSVICLPRNEITFGHVSVPSLPQIDPSVE